MNKDDLKSGEALHEHDKIETHSLTNNLTSDLTAILADDPRTETAVIEIINERGVITLSGVVPDLQTKEAAATLIKRHPDVISVNNSLQVGPR